MKDGLIYYSRFLDDIKKRIRQAQTRAVLSANAEMIILQKYVKIRKKSFILTGSFKISSCGIGMGEV